MFGLPKRKPRKAGVRKTVQSKLRTKKTTKGKPRSAPPSRKAPHSAKASRGKPHSAKASRGKPHSAKATRGKPHSAKATRGRPHSAKASRGRQDKPIGEVTHYFGNIKVAVIKFKKPFIRGDRIAIRGATTDFTQVVQSMQLEHTPIDRVKRGQEVGLKVKKRVRQGDSVFGA